MKLEPMLASPLKDPQQFERILSGPEWSLERKFDGVRVLLVHADGRTRMLTRTGRDIAGKFPEIVHAAGVYGIQGIVLDGELVIPGKGLTAVVSRSNGRDVPRGMIREGAVLMAFDVLSVGPEDMTGWLLRQRREVLTVAVDGPSLEEIQRSVPLDIKADAWARGLSDGWEGLVAKHEDSRYRPGVRSRDWIKVKYRFELRVLAYGIEPSKTSGYGSMKVGVLEGNDLDRLVPIGTVGTGFTSSDMQAVISELGYGRPTPVVISCMGRTAGGLREPVFLRFDRSPGISAPAAQLDDLPTF